MTAQEKREFPLNLLPEEGKFPWLLATLTASFVGPMVFMLLVIAFGI
ncbi:MAG: hypothetical protein AAGI44_08570 [Pseudomonadota bacterium]